MPRMRYLHSCECGCGGSTYSRFVPGHDAKLKSLLLREARAGNEYAKSELERLGWIKFLYAGSAQGRSFGVEMEVLGMCSEIAEILRDAGIDARDEYYNHDVRTYWKVTTDNSIHNPNGTGSEIVSPVLRGAAGFAQLKKVCDVLSKAGIKVNKTCGLHVHHGIQDLDVTSVYRIGQSYRNMQSDIDRVLAPSRRSDSYNTYCKPLGSYQMSTLEYGTSLSNIAANWDRYHVLNLLSYARYGTLEFRQHHGTVEYAKISAWVRFGQALIEHAKIGRMADRMVEVIPADDINFWYERRAKFESRELRQAA